MVSSAAWYSNAKANALKGNVKIGTNPIKAAWFKSTYAINLDTDQLYSGIANESTGTNYPGGGVILTGVSVTVTAANAWSVTAAVTTAYVVDQLVKPAGGNGFVYRCVVAGVSGGAAPAWPTVKGQTVADGTVTWVCFGRAVAVFTGTVPTLVNVTSADIQRLVFYDSTTSTLLCVYDLGAAQAPAGQNIVYTPDAVHGIAYDAV